jgi:hypothetical protein
MDPGNEISFSLKAISLASPTPKSDERLGDPPAANLDLPIERALNGSVLVGLVPEVVFGLMASDAVDQFFCRFKHEAERQRLRPH